MSNASESIDMTPAAAPEWTGTNLPGDVAEAGIQKNKPEFQDDLRWWYRYAAAKNIPQAEAARILGCDGSTYSRVFRGEYRNAQQLILPPPIMMLTRIRTLRDKEAAEIEKRSAGRVKTPTTEEIWGVCTKAWRDGNIAFIFGESHIGKTEGAVWFRDEHNHGATLYVDLQGVMGVQDIYRAFARALRISADTPIAKLMPRVFAAIDKTNLVIVDEFHHITYAYQKGSAVKMVNALKAIKDRTGCAMVVISTNVGREEFIEGKGHEAQLLKQLWRRGVIRLQLPDALRVGDVRAFALAYHLDFPDAPKSGADTWKALRAEYSDFVALDLCERIAYENGVKHLVSVIQDGNVLAKKRGRELSWKDVIDAQGKYDALAAKKAV